MSWLCIQPTVKRFCYDYFLILSEGWRGGNVSRWTKKDWIKEEGERKETARPTETDNCSGTECWKVNHTFVSHWFANKSKYYANFNLMCAEQTISMDSTFAR